MRALADRAWPLRSPNTVALIGAPQEFGQPQSGVDKGPALLRAAGMRRILAQLRWRVEDGGDVDMASASDGAGAAADDGERGKRGALNAGIIGAGSGRLYAACRQAHATGRFVLTMGGDHSIAMATCAARGSGAPFRRAPFRANRIKGRRALSPLPFAGR